MYNKNSGYGQGIINMVSNLVPAFGRIFVVMASGDAGEERYDRMQELMDTDPNGILRFFNTLDEAYAACTSNNNDVILLDGDGTHTLTEPIAWSKNRIHVVGMDGGERLVQQGTKIQNNSDDTEAYVIKVTGTRNSFRNIKFIQVSAEATALNVIQMGGEGNLYKNCSFVFGVADNLDETTSSEVLCGEDSGTFINCTFGSDTLLTSAARAVMTIDQVTASQELKDCQFKDCVWNIQSSSADANFIKVAATTDLKFGNLFVNPVFLAAINQTNSAVTLTDAVDSVSSLVEGNALFVNPASNCTNFCSAVTDNFKVIGYGMDGTTPAAKIGIGLTPS